MTKVLSTPMRLLCALVFCLFSFLYLYEYQADVMFVAQRIASGGKTHYEALVGAILITLTLQLLQLAVYGVTKLYKRSHSLTYFPSFLALAFLTSVPSEADTELSVGNWAWILPLVLLLYAGVVWFMRSYQPWEENVNRFGLSSPLIWISMCGMGLLMMAVALVGNHDVSFHERARMERMLDENIRYYTEHRDTIENPNQQEADAMLNRLLMQRQLRTFSHRLPRYYDVSQPLPHYYAEALVLNMSQTKHPQVFWKSREMDSLWLDFTEMKKASAKSYQLREAFRKRYGDTYWYYYFQSQKSAD